MKMWVHWSHHITWLGSWALIPYSLIQVYYVRVCLDLWPPLSYPLSMSSPMCFSAGLNRAPFSQLLFLSEVCLIALLCNMLSSLSLPKPMRLTLWSQLLFLENSQFTRGFLSPFFYAQGKTNQKEAAIPLCLKLHLRMEPQNKRQNPIVAQRISGPGGLVAIGPW